MIFLDNLTQDKHYGLVVKELVEGATILRVHRDVFNLAATLVQEDADKLRRAAPALFAPDYRTWLDIDMGDGAMALYFQGQGGESVTVGEAMLIMQHRDDPTPMLTPCHLHLPTGQLALGYSPVAQKKMANMQLPTPRVDPILANKALHDLVPIILAILALVNSPKVVKKSVVDHHKLNKKRTMKGSYAYHPHHSVTLDIDKKTVRTTAGYGEGGGKALHMVRGTSSTGQ